MVDKENLQSTEKTFFSGKRPWSKIKDQVLGGYVPAYLAKVAKLGKRIILIDAFAGPGKFEDGKPGSPLIICQAAEKYARDQYRAIFVNRDKEFNDKLIYVLKSFIDQKKVIPVLGSSRDLLRAVQSLLTDQTVFIYLDPFGLKGCEFATIEPFLKRNKAYSTEVLVNLSVPTVHRLAASKAVAEGRSDSPQVRSFHQTLSQVLGGDYWKEIMWDEKRRPEAKVEEVVSQYRDKLVQFGLPFAGSCPVREKTSSGIKYYITFCSRSPDAMLLMNDIMCDAYETRMHEAATSATPLLAKTEWEDTRGLEGLANVICKAAGRFPGRSRAHLWLEIVRENFMRYLSKEYKEAVQQLVRKRRVRFDDVRRTGRLNDDARLYLT